MKTINLLESENLPSIAEDKMEIENETVQTNDSSINKTDRKSRNVESVTVLNMFIFTCRPENSLTIFSSDLHLFS